jgi:hypothetical protein
LGHGPGPHPGRKGIPWTSGCAARNWREIALKRKGEQGIPARGLRSPKTLNPARTWSKWSGIKKSFSGGPLRGCQRNSPENGPLFKKGCDPGERRQGPFDRENSDPPFPGYCPGNGYGLQNQHCLPVRPQSCGGDHRRGSLCHRGGLLQPENRRVRSRIS